jgi:AcrR family transcriptional regulator
MKTMPTPKKRGRPRLFDESQVLAAVMDTFWTRGYAGTSLDDLAEAAGINRPSLYATFGDKQTMYLRAVAYFEAAMEAQLRLSLDQDRPLIEGLVEFYQSSIEFYLSGEGPPRGCLVICTAATEAPEEPAIRQALARVLAKMDHAFEVRIARAVERGELPRSADPRVLGQLAAAVMHSLAVRARAGSRREQLLTFSRTAAVQILGPRSARA